VELVTALGELLPPFWSRGDPVDIVATITHGVPERVIELVAQSDAVDAVITLALIGSPSSGRPGHRRTPTGDGALDGNGFAAGSAPQGSRPFVELNDRETALLKHIAAIMERTGKPIVSVPLYPVVRSVFPGLGRYAPVLLPSPGSAVSALASATWYAMHRVRRS